MPIKTLRLFNEKVSRLERCKLAERMKNPHYVIQYKEIVNRKWIAFDDVSEDDIDAFVLNLRLLIQDSDGFERTLPWIPFVVEGRRCLPDAFKRRLYTAVQSIMNKKRGLKVPSIFCEAAQINIDSVNLKKEHPSQNDYFVEPRKFYRCPKTGYKYYCKSVLNGLADLYLVESYQNGTLIQAQFSQKLIHATLDEYDEITDAKEIQRLKTMFSKIK